MNVILTHIRLVATSSVVFIVFSIVFDDAICEAPIGRMYNSEHIRDEPVFEEEITFVISLSITSRELL